MRRKKNHGLARSVVRIDEAIDRFLRRLLHRICATVTYALHARIGATLSKRYTQRRINPIAAGRVAHLCRARTRRVTRFLSARLKNIITTA